ncbi:hypothetical protein M3Y94_00992400 [Aphelenchoides besseyi]|nr:hypothetical protein M3Y94_00992400 [Aphelenchoides besseyi]KAI6221158.1 hypothetical protein M3Y95_01011100 [Aphelenchoides besseyi]
MSITSCNGAFAVRPDCLSPATRLRIAADVHRYSTSDDDSGCILDEYSWIPNGLKPDTVHEYFSALPQDKVPYTNSVGEKWRLRQLTIQLPAHDSDATYCAHLTETERTQLANFEAMRKRDALGRGAIVRIPFDHSRRYCHQCKQVLNGDDLVVGAPERFGDCTFWHPHCFVCVECTELLVDLIYFRHNDNVFCGRHHAEQQRPRCDGCDELIFGDECTEAEGRVWHMKHFVCTLCDCQLGGQKYVVRGNRPHCVLCFQKNFGLMCNTCGLEISVDEPHITQGETRWHASVSCFSCVSCGRNLLGKTYALKSSALYCNGDGCEKRKPKPQMRRNSPPQSAPPMRVRFDFRPPQPPPNRTPPLPPVQSPQNQTPPENIYETVALVDPPLSTVTATPSINRHSNASRRFRRRHSDDEDNDWESGSLSSEADCVTTPNPSVRLRSRHRKGTSRHHRRSLSMDGTTPRQCLRGCQEPQEVTSCRMERLHLKPKKQMETVKRPPQNFYSRMPLEHDSTHFPFDSYATTSSESDSDDEIYLNTCRALVAERYETPTLVTPKVRPTPRTIVSHRQLTDRTPRRPNSQFAKKKSNPNCFIS